MFSSHIEVTPELDAYLKRVSLREHPARLKQGAMQITPELGELRRLSEAGSVAWATHRPGVFRIPTRWPYGRSTKP